MSTNHEIFGSFKLDLSSIKLVEDFKELDSASLQVIFSSPKTCSDS